MKSSGSSKVCWIKAFMKGPAENCLHNNRVNGYGIKKHCSRFAFSFLELRLRQWEGFMFSERKSFIAFLWLIVLLFGCQWCSTCLYWYANDYEKNSMEVEGSMD
jgi:hypothetical protein